MCYLSKAPSKFFSENHTSQLQVHTLHRRPTPIIRAYPYYPLLDDFDVHVHYVMYIVCGVLAQGGLLYLVIGAETGICPVVGQRL